MSPATCLPAGCFCEALREGIRQPANTWSNLGFVLSGLMILASDPGGMGRAQARLYGWIVVFLGVGSAVFHATLTFAGQWVDVLSMYLFPTFLILHDLRRLGRLGPAGAAVLLVGVNAALGLAYAGGAWDRGAESFGVLLAVLAGLEALRWRELGARRDARFLFAGAGTFAAAWGLWLLDITGAWCRPASLLQGHAAWHLLGAVAAWLLFRYYASEGPAAETPEPLAAPARA